MSLTLYLRETPCEKCGHGREGFHINYTYNVAPMWYKIFPNDKGMVMIEGMAGAEACYKLMAAHKYMHDHKNIMLPLEPSNGWGSYEGFLEFIDKCFIASSNNPTLIWEACR